MSKIIEFLEKCGQDADLRYATDAELLAALMQADIDKVAQTAILRKDSRVLEALVDANANVCCMIARSLPENEDDEAEEEVEDDGDDEKASGVKSHVPPARRAA